MSWSAATVGIAGRFSGADAPQVDPSWQPWLDLLDIALEERDSPWHSAVVFGTHRPAGAPLMHGASLRLDAQCAGSLVRRLAESAALARAAQLDARAAIRAAIARDDDALAAMADELELSVDSVALLAQVASMPLLFGAASALTDGEARAWQRGYCPVCGAWPSLAEIRGIERERHLRCGRCGGDWILPLLRCAFCDEGDHEKLASLRAEGEEHLRQVETCERCHGYLKAVTTFDALGTRALMLADLSTIPLDLVAQERGYARPARPGWAPAVDVVT